MFFANERRFWVSESEIRILSRKHEVLCIIVQLIENIFTISIMLNVTNCF